MRHTLTLIIAASLLLVAGCATAKPTTSTSMEPAIRAKVDKGVIEPGFTPEMVYLALGKPTEPAESLADATTNGTWVYHNFEAKGRDMIKPGFRRHVVSDPVKKIDVIKTEPIERAALQKLPANSLHVTFRDGRVAEIQRVADI
jgi:hypothetical protein